MLNSQALGRCCSSGKLTKNKSNLRYSIPSPVVKKARRVKFAEVPQRQDESECDGDNDEDEDNDEFEEPGKRKRGVEKRLKPAAKNKKAKGHKAATSKHMNARAGAAPFSQKRRRHVLLHLPVCD